MLELRSPIILAAGPAGLAISALAWLVLGGPNQPAKRLEELGVEFRSLPKVQSQGASSPTSPDASAMPQGLFANSAQEISVSLVGLSRTPKRSAALLSIKSQPAQWMTVGMTKEGVTLVQVLPTRVVIDSLTGRRSIGIGQSSGAIEPSDASGDQPPAGARLPPPPASAPSQP